MLLLLVVVVVVLLLLLVVVVLVLLLLAGPSTSASTNPKDDDDDDDDDDDVFANLVACPPGPCTCTPAGRGRSTRKATGSRACACWRASSTSRTGSELSPATKISTPTGRRSATVGPSVMARTCRRKYDSKGAHGAPNTVPVVAAVEAISEPDLGLDLELVRAKVEVEVEVEVEGDEELEG